MGVVNSYHRAVIIAAEAGEGTESMPNHWENESTMRSFFWNIPVHVFHVFVQALLVNVHRKLNALGKYIVTSESLCNFNLNSGPQIIQQYLQEHCFCICPIT